MRNTCINLQKQASYSFLNLQLKQFFCGCMLLECMLYVVHAGCSSYAPLKCVFFFLAVCTNQSWLHAA